MRSGDLGERVDEHRAAVEALGARDAGTAGVADDLLVELEERLDVIAGEGDGDEQQIGLALGHVGRDGVAGLRAQPGGGADLGLPAEAVRVREAEARHDGVDGRGYFGGVGVACLDRWRLGVWEEI